jgi:septum formation protein
MQQQSHKRSLILASSSPYRKLLLQRLGLPFSTFDPQIDETPLAGEAAGELVSRLAREKATEAAGRYPGAAVIGCDQVAVCEGKIAGKPGTVSAATRQLQSFSGQTVQFLSAVSLVCEDTGFARHHTVVTDICFRKLSGAEIERYIALDNPLDCAGSFKSECAGVTLLKSMTSEDPTAIIGLPLIALSQALRKAGFQLP